MTPTAAEVGEFCFTDVVFGDGKLGIREPFSEVLDDCIFLNELRSKTIPKIKQFNKRKVNREND